MLVLRHRERARDLGRLQYGRRPLCELVEGHLLSNPAFTPLIRYKPSATNFTWLSAEWAGAIADGGDHGAREQLLAQFAGCPGAVVSAMAGSLVDPGPPADFSPSITRIP